MFCSSSSCLYLCLTINQPQQSIWLGHVSLRTKQHAAKFCMGFFVSLFLSFFVSFFVSFCLSFFSPRGKKDAPTFKSLRSPHKFWQRAVSYLDQCDQAKSIGVVGLLTNINISDQTMSRTCTKNKQLPLSMLICRTQATLLWYLQQAHRTGRRGH